MGAYLECNLVRGCVGLLDPVYSATKELLRMRLAVQHLIRRDGA
jgi:hypothetical protein